MESFIRDKVAQYNANGTNIDYQQLVMDTLRVYPDFLIDGRKNGVYSTQEERIRGWVMRLLDRLKLTIRSPTHIAQNAANNVAVYQDAVDFANMILLFDHPTTLILQHMLLISVLFQ